MKLHKYQKYLLLSLATTIVITGYYSIQSQIGLNSTPHYFLLDILFTVLVSISIVLVNFPIFDKIKAIYRIDKELLKSVILGFLITSISASILISFWILVFYFTVSSYRAAIESLDNGMFYVLFNNIVTAVIVNTFIGAFVVIRHITMEWKKAVVEAEKFKRISIESQYATLVNQINPHFLFNSLNALVSLIPQSPEKAVEFVNKFSKIYRYVLEAKDKIVCEVKNEIDFMDSYCFLQKIRFGENLIIEKQIDSDYLAQFLPPLSLQLLIENAIKHNEISKTNPLKVSIYTKEQFIIVENTLKLKALDDDSTGIGLKNLKDRYEHLSDKKPEFYIKNNLYIAKLPIIVED